MDTQVLIVGGGPVGLTLAIDLGRRGVRCILIEKNDAPLGYPKMERCNPRTMEIFRRLGLADTVRAAGYPPDWPMDTYLLFDLMHPPLFKMAHPTVASAKAKRDATLDGSMPLEPYQIISQYTLEPLLKSVAEKIPNVAVKFGHEFESFVEGSDGVTLHARTTAGDRVSFRAQYLVGCDGGSSAVRKQLGFRMEGEPHILEMRQALFHCPELYAKVIAPRARHYHRIDEHWTLMIVQDSREHFTLHAVVEKDEDMVRLFEKIVGTPIQYRMLHCAKWVQRLLLAEHYAQGRAFIAGDAAHLVIPTGGLGMNTGIGDAIDISWKLAATLQHWGGPKLLRSYEAERRPIGAINVQASGRGTTGRSKWRSAYRPCIADDTPEGKAALANLLAIAADEAPKSFRVVGAELGYRYAGSPIICDEPGGPEPNIDAYEPTTWPGARLPHVWLEAGTLSVHDRIGDGYTLLRLGRTKADASDLKHAFDTVGAPLSLLDIDSEVVRRVYGFDYLLVRPDLHVTWRGNALPKDSEQLARVVTGW
ncbi:MAG TPA: FAD-dependent monooxygenase [Xanthobacteraceae bacterium]|jgi:2-polyprenyl-6-methoxyphenol hydroxylase-like FAD-dependent oxidoreductase|nr:FAD-dependent monooxygenase [Xanthobacteraceae bacterium]